MDADLQNDPRDIPMMLEYYKNYDLVNGWRKNRKDTFSKKLAGKIGNTVSKLGSKRFHKRYRVRPQNYE